MNINQIKLEVSNKSGKPCSTLTMVRQLTNDAAKTPTEWLSHWDNDNRIRVSMHQDVFNQIKANPAFDGLAVKKELVAAKVENGTEIRAAYLRFVVITPKNIEATF